MSVTFFKREIEMKNNVTWTNLLTTFFTKHSINVYNACILSAYLYKNSISYVNIEIFDIFFICILTIIGERSPTV